MKEYILSQCEELEPLIIVDAQGGGKEIVTTVKQGVGLSLKKEKKKRSKQTIYLVFWHFEHHNAINSSLFKI